MFRNLWLLIKTFLPLSVSLSVTLSVTLCLSLGDSITICGRAQQRFVRELSCMYRQGSADVDCGPRASVSIAVRNDETNSDTRHFSRFTRRSNACRRTPSRIDRRKRFRSLVSHPTHVHLGRAPPSLIASLSFAVCSICSMRKSSPSGRRSTKRSASSRTFVRRPHRAPSRCRVARTNKIVLLLSVAGTCRSDSIECATSRCSRKASKYCAVR